MFIITSIAIHGQTKKDVSCSSPTLALKKEKQTRQQHQVTTKNFKTAGTNPRAYTQSIHNTIVKWDDGSFYRYSIGTEPGRNDINRGSLLNNTAKHTGGHSYEDLKISASEQGNTFSIGDTFYFSLYDADDTIPAWVSPPLEFKWENLGIPTNQLTINIETNYGVNGLGPFTTEQQQKMMAFYNLMNPIIKEIYGPPSRNHEVTIINDGNAISTNVFFNGPNQIHSTFQEKEGDLKSPRLMTHELVHAYRDNVILSSNKNWHFDSTLSGFEEGMAEAVAIIAMDIFIERYPTFFNNDEFNIHWSHSKSMSFDWDYDFQNHSQLTTTDFFSSDIGTGAHWERYGTGQAAMQKIYTEDPNIFKKFNQIYYQRLNADHTLINSRTLIVDIFNEIIAQIERTPTTDWINKQHIFDCKVVPGKKVHMLTFHTANPPRIHTLDNRIHAIETQNLPKGNEWSWDEIDPTDSNNSKRWFIQTNNLDGELKIYNYDNTLHQSVKIRNNKTSLKEGKGEYLGPYQGPNLLNYNGTFTANDNKDDCTQPNCGKKPKGIDTHNFRSTSTNDINHMDLPNDMPDPTTQKILNLSELGLYRYDITFEGSNYQGTYYRVHGQDLVQKKGIFGGIKSKDDANLISGKLVIEHEDYGEEPIITISNGAFISEREWASILETETHRQGGRTDRHYSAPGKTHTIYINEDCTEQKIDFRNIKYGDGLAGSQLFLFTVDDFQDIEFDTETTASACDGESLTLEVTNNFPDILDKDSRVTYSWLNPNNIEIATQASHTIKEITTADEGIYSLEISFFGCLITKEIKVTVDSVNFDITIPTEVSICESETLTLAIEHIDGGTYSWTGPNGFSSNEREINIPNTTIGEQGIYTASITALDCNKLPITKEATTNVIITTDTAAPTITTSDINACVGDTVLLTTTLIEGATYNWTGPNGFISSDREITIPAITIDQQGNYIVTVTTSNCKGNTVENTNNLSLNLQPSPPNLVEDLPESVTICSGESFSINIPLYPDATYHWKGPNNFNAVTPEFFIDQFTEALAGIYTLQIFIPNCGITTEQQYAVSLEICTPPKAIPTYFTPNNDGYHDYWSINNETISYKRIEIFNRHGKLLKQLTPTNNKWNGTFNGTPMPSAEYWYTIYYINKKPETGHFSLIR